jgi:hypothetical protein
MKSNLKQSPSETLDGNMESAHIDSEDIEYSWAAFTGLVYTAASASVGTAKRKHQD